jgi:hypothetical protein
MFTATQGKFTRVVPMTTRNDAAGKYLADFTDDVGIPERLVTDGATYSPDGTPILSKKRDECA